MKAEISQFHAVVKNNIKLAIPSTSNCNRWCNTTVTTATTKKCTKKVFFRPVLSSIRVLLYKNLEQKGNIKYQYKSVSLSYVIFLLLLWGCFLNKR